MKYLLTLLVFSFLSSPLIANKVPMTEEQYVVYYQNRVSTFESKLSQAKKILDKNLSAVKELKESIKKNESSLAESEIDAEKASLKKKIAEQQKELENTSVALKDAMYENKIYGENVMKAKEKLEAYKQKVKKRRNNSF